MLFPKRFVVAQRYEERIQRLSGHPEKPQRDKGESTVNPTARYLNELLARFELQDEGIQL